MARQVALLLSLIMGSLGVSAHAAAVHVTATGTFSVYSDPGMLLPFAMPAPGSTFTLTFSYDDSAADVTEGGGPTPDIGLYPGAVSSMSLSFPGESFTSSGSNSIVILNDAPGTEFADSWQSWGDVSTAGNLEHDIGMFLLNVASAPPVDPLASDALVTPFTSPDWDIAVLRYRVVEKPVVGDPFVAAMADAIIDSIEVTVIPVPAAVWLFGSALALLATARRKLQPTY